MSSEIAVSAVSLAELAVGPTAAGDELSRLRRLNHLRRVEAEAKALPFDSACARAYARVYAAPESESIDPDLLNRCGFRPSECFVKAMQRRGWFRGTT